MFRFSTCGALQFTALGSDETSLMQGFKPLPELKRRDDKHAVDNLLESAKGMLKNGETEDVVTFAQATLDEILASVLPAIRDASAAEQVQLDAVFALFEGALQALQEGNEEVTHGFARLWGIVRDGEEAYVTHVPICEERFRGLPFKSSFQFVKKIG